MDRDTMLARYRALDDPLDRYDAACAMRDDAEVLVGLAADMAARALAELHVDGMSYGRIAEAIGVSRQRAAQLVQRGADVVV